MKATSEEKILVEPGTYDPLHMTTGMPGTGHP